MNLSLEICQKKVKSKLVKLTDKEENSLANRGTDNGKFSNVSKMNLIGNEYERHSKKLEIEPEMNTEQKWVTSPFRNRI